MSTGTFITLMVLNGLTLGFLLIAIYLAKKTQKYNRLAEKLRFASLTGKEPDLNEWEKKEMIKLGLR